MNVNTAQGINTTAILYLLKSSLLDENVGTVAAAVVNARDLELLTFAFKSLRSFIPNKIG